MSADAARASLVRRALVPRFGTFSAIPRTIAALERLMGSKAVCAPAHLRVVRAMMNRQSQKYGCADIPCHRSGRDRGALWKITHYLTAQLSAAVFGPWIMFHSAITLSVGNAREGTETRTARTRSALKRCWKRAVGLTSYTRSMLQMDDRRPKSAVWRMRWQRQEC